MQRRLWGSLRDLVSWVSGFFIFLAAPGLALAQVASGSVPCQSGRAGEFLCQDVDLVAHLGLPDLGGVDGGGGDGWGWSDPETRREYAIVGHSKGTAFVDVTDPDAVTYLGLLSTHGGKEVSNPHLRVYRNHLYVVRAGSPGGLQVFDLTGLRNVQATPQAFAETAFYPAFGSARNIAINDEAGIAYVVGGGCDLQMLSLQDPVRPASVGCFREQPGRPAAVDAHCVVYRGPDVSYRGRKVCFVPRQEWVSIVDVQDGARPRAIAQLSYLDVGSASQGWLTDDHRYYLQADASDERAYDHATRTYLWDVADLEDPKPVGSYDASTRASDSALCVKGNELHQANSEAGYRILSLSRVASGQLDEVAYFDMHPASDSNTRPGAFSSYPFFGSGRVAVSDTALGLFVLQPTACRSPATPARRTPADGGSRVATSSALDWEDVAGAASYDVDVATDPKFERVLRVQTSLASSSWTVTPPLAAATVYWWRVRAAAGCGTGAWSAGLSFTTASRSPVKRTPRVRSVQGALRVLTKRDPSTLTRRKIEKRPLP